MYLITGPGGFRHMTPTWSEALQMAEEAAEHPAILNYRERRRTVVPHKMLEIELVPAMQPITCDTNRTVVRVKEV